MTRAFFRSSYLHFGFYTSQVGASGHDRSERFDRNVPAGQILWRASCQLVHSLWRGKLSEDWGVLLYSHKLEWKWVKKSKSQGRGCTFYGLQWGVSEGFPTLLSFRDIPPGFKIDQSEGFKCLNTYIQTWRREKNNQQTRGSGWLAQIYSHRYQYPLEVHFLRYYGELPNSHLCLCFLKSLQVESGLPWLCWASEVSNCLYHWDLKKPPRTHNVRSNRILLYFYPLGIIDRKALKALHVAAKWILDYTVCSRAYADG